MDRRSFLLALSAATTARWVRAASPPELPTVAILAQSTAENFKGRAEAFRRGMRALGYVEGKNVHYQWRYGNDRSDRLDALARELASLHPAATLADSSTTVVRMRQAAPDLPIVMASADDPVGSRFVRTLDKPGTQVTGLSAGNPDAILKSVEFLAALMRKDQPIALLANQNNATYRKIRARFRHAALQAGLQPLMFDANQPQEIASAFTALRKERAAGVVVMADAMFYDERRRIVKLATAARHPAIYPDRAYVDAGGLMSYGADMEASFERAAAFVDRIVKGAAPGDVPAEEPKEYRLVVNRRAARALNVALPQPLLKQAHAVIG